jgi:hypothetical protein
MVLEGEPVCVETAGIASCTFEELETLVKDEWLTLDELSTKAEVAVCAVVFNDDCANGIEAELGNVSLNTGRIEGTEVSSISIGCGCW